MWADLIGSFDFLKLCILGSALLIFHTVACYFAFKLIKNVRWAFLIWVLLGIATVFVVYKNSRILPVNSADSNQFSEWQPPELPPDCKVAYFFWGDMNWEIDLEKLNFRKPYFDIGFGGTSNIFFTIFLQNNRLYVQEYTAFKGRTNVDMENISNPYIFDKSLPYYDDRNFSKNAFETINKQGCPTLQVIYIRPNAIRVNGVFTFGTRADKDAKNINPLPVAQMIVFGTNFNIFKFKSWNDEEKNLMPFKTNVLFIYPSYQHLGEYAN